MKLYEITITSCNYIMTEIRQTKFQNDINILSATNISKIFLYDGSLKKKISDARSSKNTTAIQDY